MIGLGLIYTPKKIPRTAMLPTTTITKDIASSKSNT